MQLRMWTYDIAREQSPPIDFLRTLCGISLEAGYNAMGLYLEHRFAYPSTPWSHGRGCLTPEAVVQIQSEFPQLQIVPFVNLLGHFEGMIYTEAGKRFREERFQGMQACPSNPAFDALARGILDDVVDVFRSPLIHIGGDETWQLGRCPRCADRVAKADESGADGKALLYGEHFAPLARHVVERGRRPAVWGDMFLDHPAALDPMPDETLIFDWQYFKSPLETSRRFVDRGFEVVCCPTLHTYNAVWLHLAQSEENLRQAVEAAVELNAAGVCLTTWECGLFGNYETLVPAIRGGGKLLVADTTNTLADTYATESERHGRWARLMGIDLQALGGVFGFSATRSSLKARLLLQGNPFLAWMHHHEELCGEVGDRALAILEEAIQNAPDPSYRGVSEFAKAAVEFVRFADQARQAYANGLPGLAATSLAPCRQVFENLEKTALAAHLRIGGSLADVERCRLARDHVERVIKRIKEFGDGSLGYLPAFEILTHPKFVPHDQAAWWLINRWAND